MDLLKKNLMSVICGVVALGAIAAVFYPIHGYYAELQAAGNARVSVAQKLKSLMNTPRKKPLLEPGVTETASLETYPTQNVIDAYSKAVVGLKDQSAKLFATVVKLSAAGHEQLVPGALPDGNTAVATSFREKYRALMNQTTEQGRQSTIAIQILNGGFPPTDDQIRTRRKDIEDKMKADNPSTVHGQPWFMQQLDRARAEVPEKLSQEFASKIKCYIDNQALSPSSAMIQNVTSTPDASLIFVAQMGLWIHEDVLNALKEANKDAKSVADAPVKHLFKIAFSDPTFKQFTGPAMPPGSPGAPPPPVEDPAQTIAKNFSRTPTGRITTGLFDVIRFTVRVNVDAEQVPRVLQEMSRNRYITVLSCNLLQVDSGSMQVRRFYYGEKPVVQLEMDCEELLMRQWLAPLMPTLVRASLSIPAPKDPAAAPK